MALCVGLALATPVGAAEFFGPTPYLSAADTPTGFTDGATFVEDFEDGVADPRLSFPLGGSVIGPGGIVDSVDADDGTLDGSGTAGRSFFKFPPFEVAFSAPFPTSAGVLWTDGGTPTDGAVFEAFGPDGELLGTIGPFTLGDGNNNGGTSEDRFFGARDAGGISRLRLTHASGGIEVDHIQFTDGARVESALLGTLEDGDLGLLLPNPAAGLPNPVQTAFSLPLDAAPHGAAFARGGSEAVFADFLTPTLYRAPLADSATVASIALTGRTSGNGTLAADPYGRYLLSVGRANNGSGESVVVDLGVTPPQVTPIQPTLNVAQFVTAAIDFAPDGRAFVCHATGVSVLSPPYTTVDFTMDFPAIQLSGSQCRLSRDGSRLFVTRVLSETVPTVNGVRTTAAPYSANSQFVTMPAPLDVQGLGPMAVSPDGEALLVGQQFLFPQAPNPPRARLFLLRAPFDGQAAYQEIALPAAVSGNNCVDGANPFDCAGFEHIEVSDDGSLAILTGNSSSVAPNAADKVPAVFVQAPFDDASRTVVAVPIAPESNDSLGRGTGAVRFQPTGLFRDGLE